jgi:pimeloyl-ACP methyl ester carboxylesterase
MPSQRIDSTDFWFLEAGKPALPTLVLVHGFPLDSRLWAEQVADLSGSFRVIAPDLRGFGKSRSDEPFTMSSLADDLHKLLEKIGALPCVLAGLSMGGYVCLPYARKYPGDLKGLVLVDSRCEADTPAAKESRGKMIELVRNQGSAAVADAMLPRLIAPGALANRPVVVQKIMSIMGDCPALTIEHALAAMRDREDHTEWLANADLAVHIIVGEHDAITPPAGARATAARLKRGDLTVIPAAGHLTPIEQPRLVSLALRRNMRESFKIPRSFHEA